MGPQLQCPPDYTLINPQAMRFLCYLPHVSLTAQSFQTKLFCLHASVLKARTSLRAAACTRLWPPVLWRFGTTAQTIIAPGDAHFMLIHQNKLFLQITGVKQLHYCLCIPAIQVEWVTPIMSNCKKLHVGRQTILRVLFTPLCCTSKRKRQVKRNSFVYYITL